MFFNENFYLNEEEQQNAEAEVTDAEIKEAEETVADEADKAGVSEEDITSPEATDAQTAENMQEATEYYYCLRERMMNVEHVAALKAKDGLVSESSMLLESGWDNFKNKMVDFFKKIKALIKNLFDKFVNFIQSLTVSATDIKNANGGTAWKAFQERTKNMKIKVNILNTTRKDMDAAQAYVVSLYANMKKDVSDLETAYKGLTDADKDGKKDLDEKLDRSKKLKDRVNAAKSEVNSYIEKVISNDGSNTVLSKKETELTADVFTQALDYVKQYDKILGVAKKTKADAEKILDECIKHVKEEAKNEGQKKYQSKTIAQMRWIGSKTASVYSRHTSIMKQFYRQSLLVCRRVIGAQKAAENKERWKEMTSESFDMRNYFNI